MECQIHVINKHNDSQFTENDLIEFFDMSRIGFWKVIIEEGKTVQMYMDANMQALIGLPEGLSAEESYEFYFEHIFPEDRYMLSEYDTVMLEKDMVAEYRYNHPQNGEMRIRCRCKKIGESDDKITIIGYEQEISGVIQLGSGTKREDELLKKNHDLEEEQVQTNDYYKNLLDMMHCGVISYTIPDHRILHMNANALRIYGLESVAEAQCSMNDLLHKVVYPDADVPKRLKGLWYESGVVDYECTVINKKGTSTNIVARTETFSTPSKEKCLVTTFLDVSENQALKNEKEILAALCADYTSVYICDLMTDSVVPVYPTDVRDEIQGEKKIGDGIHRLSFRAKYSYEHLIIQESAPDFLEKINASYLMKYLEKHKRFVYRVRLKPNPYGRENYEIQIVRLDSAEGFKVIVGFHYIDDAIREEERHKVELENALKAAKLANESKTNFLRRMSHDIRTPLNGILGLIKIDETHFDDMELVRENHQKMKTSANYLLSLINDVLQMSKLEDGKIVISHEPIDLINMSKDIIDIISVRAAEAGITWVYGSTGKTVQYPYVYGSPLHLRQIFLNIYGNCIKYNKPGGSITTSVEALETKKGICTYRWTISDTGIGMSREFIDHIFDPFAQEKTNTISTSQGIGLGMAIVKGLIDQMNGTIEITSEEGAGSTFVITIPFDIAETPETGETEQIEKDIDISGLNLLLVEDNELNAEIAQTLLEDEGAKTTLAANGQEAVQLFNESAAGEYDAILMDMMMPVMDGLTATRAIRAMERPDAKTVPIVAMTANAFDEDRKKALESGMNDHVAKPIDMNKLIPVLLKFIK